MSRVSSLYRTCQELFADYPLAISVGEDAESSIVLMTDDDEGVQFYVLSRGTDGKSAYTLRHWHSTYRVKIDAYVDPATSDVAVNVVTHGIPVPRDGSLFGWRHGNSIIAMIAVYAECSPESPDPTWSVMPLAGTSEVQWPPFTGEPVIRHWFWEHYRAGHLVLLDALIAGTGGTVFWVSTAAVVGWDSCIVANEISSGEGYVLPSGCYVYYRALRAGRTVPSLDALLADTDKTDLAPWFECATYADR